MMGQVIAFPQRPDTTPTAEISPRLLLAECKQRREAVHEALARGEPLEADLERLDRAITQLEAILEEAPCL